MVLTIIQIAIIIVLLILSAFFSSSETALTAISPHRVRAMAEENVRGADVLEKILAQNSKMLSVILICNNIVNLTASALTTVVVQKLFGNRAISIGTGILTLLVLIFGEVAPKTMATYRAEKIALRYCRIIYALMVVFTPIAAAINFLAKGVLRIFGLRKDEKADKITESELRTIVEVSHEEGVIEEEEKEFINNIFDFADTTVKEVMVPRINVTAISINDSYETIRDIFKEELYTRLPVFDEDGEKVIGIINVKDLVFYPEEEIEGFEVKKILREVGYTFEQKHLSELFIEMKRTSQGMMIVLDEYGDLAGIVTMEDLLEEIVGDIRDEYDENENEELVKTGPNEYTIFAHMSLDDINDRLGLELESEDYTSIGGLMLDKLEHIPEQGESVELGNIRLTAEKVDNARIELVKLQIINEQ
ncbi:MAG: HlyC/CorC family transporter [Lachnospiraceae bacterium]|nr:HlyC/CorC family transporter [Lachnospiraceae bacterium]